jgi:hypothetical protein
MAVRKDLCLQVPFRCDNPQSNGKNILRPRFGSRKNANGNLLPYALLLEILCSFSRPLQLVMLSLDYSIKSAKLSM